MNSNPQPSYSWPVSAISESTGICFEAVAIAMTSILGGIAGPFAGIEGPAGEVIRPATNIIAASQSPGWTRAIELMCSPVESAQRRLRELSRSLDVPLLLQLEKNKKRLDRTLEFYEKSEESLASVDAHLFAATEQRKSEVLRQPTIYLRSPTPKALASMEEILDRAPLLVYFNGELLAPCAKTDAVAIAVVGSDDLIDHGEDSTGFGHVEALRATLFMACSRAQLQTALGSDNASLTRMINQCLIIDASECPMQPDYDENDLRRGFNEYRRAVNDAVFARRNGRGMRFGARPGAAQDLRVAIAELATWVGKLPDQIQPYFRHVLTLPHRVMWMLLATCPNADDNQARELCQGAISASWWAVERQRFLVLDLVQAEENKRQDVIRAKMLGRLRRSPCKLRDLVRIFAVQRTALYQPILEELMNAGLVLSDGGVLRLANTVYQTPESQ